MAMTLKDIKAIEFPGGVTLRQIQGTKTLEIAGGSLVETSSEFTQIELGNATDTTLARSSAGVISVEGVDVILADGGVAFTGGVTIDAGGLIITAGDLVVSASDSILTNATAATASLALSNTIAANAWVGLSVTGDNIVAGTDDDEVIIRFILRDSAGTPLLDTFGEIACVATDVSTVGDADGRIILRAAKAGTTTDAFTVGYTTAGALNFGFEGSLAAVVTITQTDSTAEATLAADSVTSIAATVDAATATVITAAVQATMSAVDGSGATAAQEGEFNNLGTWATEMDLDYEALLVDVAAIRTWNTEIDLDFEAMIVDVRDLKSAFNSVVDALQAHGILG